MNNCIHNFKKNKSKLYSFIIIFNNDIMKIILYSHIILDYDLTSPRFKQLPLSYHQLEQS